MDKKPLDINNENKNYLDEKELFILYSLYKKRYISSWNNVFIPNSTSEIHIKNTGDEEENVKNLEQQINKHFEKKQSKQQSAIVVSYLLELGKELDEKDFSIFCNANYSLIEGGFLIEDMRDIMIEYSNDTEENRKTAKKYKILNTDQLKFMNEVIRGKDFNSIEFSNLANSPIKEYKEAILNKKSEKDFIELVNKLITKDDDGRWDKNDVAKFLEIWYRHNKERFQNELENLHNNKKVDVFSEDTQTKLSRLILEHMDVHLNIKNTKKLEHYLSDYINLFRNNKLNGFSGYGLTRNFFKTTMIVPLNTKFFGFKKQEDILLKHIKDIYEKYQRDDLEIGNPFTKPEYIGDTEDDERKFILSELNEEKDLFLFVHTMIALEYDKYLEIENFSYGTTEMFDLYDRGFLFKIKLKNNKKDDTEQKLFDGYDKKYRLLKFAGKEIELAKKGKETDAVLLMETLIKTKNNEWIHNDEIFSDWGYNDDDQKELPKNKIYFAGLKINQAVAFKTQIKDFIECNTTKARINPKYKNVDE